MRLKGKTVLKTARDFIHFSEQSLKPFYVQYIRIKVYSHWSHANSKVVGR